jgi:uncharacterized protein
MGTEFERYAFPSELRTVERGTGLPKIVGRAAPYNSLSQKMYDRKVGEFYERILPGFFDPAARAGARVKAYYNHNRDAVLGSTTAGTLRLSVNGGGLNYEISPPDTNWGRDAVESIRRGDIDGTSFGMRNVKSRWLNEGGRKIRELVSGDVFDVSPTDDPAYLDTSAAVRSWLEASLGRYGPAGDGDWQMDLAEKELQIAEAELGMSPAGGDYLNEHRGRWLEPAERELAIPGSFGHLADPNADSLRRWIQLAELRR